MDYYLIKILSQGKGKGVARININKYTELYTKALVIGEPIKDIAEYSRWRYPSTVTVSKSIKRKLVKNAILFFISNF
jgi:hypothetical protein